MQDIVSVCTVTLNRKRLAEECLGPSLANADYPYELLHWDNGSTDGVQAYVRGLAPAWFHHSGGNIGYAPAVNQLMLRATGRFLCIVDPDMVLSAGWLRVLVEANTAISQSGLSSIHCVQVLPPISEVDGIRVRVNSEVYGVKFFSQKLLSEMGYLCEDFGLYGLEDNELNYRLHRAGYLNYYVDGPTCVHAGEDCGEKSPYRQMKWDSLARGVPILDRRRKYIEDTADYFVPPPQDRTWQEWPERAPGVIPEYFPVALDTWVAPQPNLSGGIGYVPSETGTDKIRGRAQRHAQDYTRK
jgi:glycosyltransferase involved in cell wall biosynthesis